MEHAFSSCIYARVLHVWQCQSAHWHEQMPAIVDFLVKMSVNEHQAFLHQPFKTRRQALAPAKQQLSGTCLPLICAMMHIDSRRNDLCLFTSVASKKLLVHRLLLDAMTAMECYMCYCQGGTGSCHQKTGQSLSKAAHVCNAIQNA